MNFISEWVPYETSSAELSIKRSRFIGLLSYIEPGSYPREFQNEAEKLFPRANHYCWAYRLLAPSLEEAASDAGEPSGTAGRPILQAMQKSLCTQAILIVIRFFGGIKLGVRGLIDAYGDTADEALNAASKAKAIWCSEFVGSLPYSDIGSFTYWYEKQELPPGLLHMDYEEAVKITIRLPFTKKDDFELLLSKLSKGDVLFKETGKKELVRLKV